MALSFIGKPISLISHSDVRYRGILAGIDPAASTIQLSNVYSMGTETRRPPSEFIPPVQEPYQYIIFRASEVKDLAVDEPTPRRSVHDDPAVLGASAPMPAAYPPYPAPPQGVAPPPPVPQPQVPPQQFNRLPPQHPQHPQRPQHPQQQPPPPVPQPVQPIHQQQLQQIPQSQGPGHASAAPVPQQQPQGRPQQGQGQGQNNNNNNNNTRRNNNSVHSAAVSLETVERAIGDLRVSANATSMPVQNSTTGGGRGGRRGRGAHRGGDQHLAPPTVDIQVPSTDFDFESSNAKFDKAALAASATSRANSTINGSSNGDEGAEVEPSNDNDKKGNGARGVGDQDKSAPVAYNPSKSFFDSLSSSTHPSISADAKGVDGAIGNSGENGVNGAGSGGRGGRGRRGGGSAARSRREEERERNVATFGEPGGVGLMGPGAYVGGWGGYGGHGHGGHGRRGGRPRRGGAGGPPPGAASVPMRG